MLAKIVTKPGEAAIIKLNPSEFKNYITRRALKSWQVEYKSAQKRELQKYDDFQITQTDMV